MSIAFPLLSLKKHIHLYTRVFYVTTVLQYYLKYYNLIGVIQIQLYNIIFFKLCKTYKLQFFNF